MIKNLKNLSLPEIEEKVLEFWQKNKIFEKSLAKKPTKPKAENYIFYDGPPFATGLPHYGHILASIIKDAVPRYQTMKGKRVPRRWGWDCHGLPVENEIEKDLGFKTKKDIENFGIGKFNETARSAVLKYADEWKKIIPRVGRWVDMENDYKTMGADYTESVWWVFKSLFDKGLVYEDYRVAPYCPRCGTPLSNFELNQPDAYRDIEDQSVYIKFKIKPGQPVGNKMSDDKTYFLVWTTTPWTLPGNIALAVRENIKYAETEIPKTSERLLYAEDSPLAKELGSVRRGIDGQELIDLKYEPLYKLQTTDYKLQTAYKVVSADFISVEDGTGIVHIAPAFGEDDMAVGKKEKLPTIITVDSEGKIKKGLKIPGEGLFVKKADEEIKKDLSKRGLLFKEEKIVHSYPHCWRCETPLLYFPVNSWYIAVKKIKDRLVKNNKKIHWVPEHVKTGRFGKWLEEVRDWDVARSRFWGAPLPIWKCGKCGALKIIGSIKELGENSKNSGNRYFILRHGEAESNHHRVNSSWPEKTPKKLTEKGRKQIQKVAETLKNKNIDLIFSSDLLRTKQTAEIISKTLKNSVKFDKRLREYDFGVFNSKTMEEFSKFIGKETNKFTRIPEGGENLNDIRRRMVNFILEIEKKHRHKNILIISHGDPLWALEAAAQGLNNDGIIKSEENYIKTGELREIRLLNLPYTNEGIVDLHRPCIDETQLECAHLMSSGQICGGIMKRVPEVFDCWFESGSMPYAQAHYPFDPDSISSRYSDNYGARNKKKLVLSPPKDFPAEFIAEGIDQTRGWFYTLLVLSTALFNKPAYKNIIVNGIILAEDGTKMSKRLKNYPDPMEIVKKYGADALRFYLLSSPVVRGENLNFSEKGVDEIYKKFIMRLWNVYRFYELYADRKIKISSSFFLPLSLNILDKWILAMFNQLNNEVSKAMDSCELDKAARPIMNFVDDFSTWYVRRSRRRFQKPENKKEFENASAIFAFILTEFSKIAAPFLPFIAEAIYLATSNKQQAISVHLESWPKADKKLVDKKLIKSMAEIRRLASLALAKRAEAGIKVRQPLQKFKVQSSKLKVDKELLKILADEINVKEIVFDGKIKDEIELDVKITSELREEGIVRDFVRLVQGLRQEAGYKPKDIIYLFVSAGDLDAVLDKNATLFKKEVGAKTIEFRHVDRFDAEEEIIINGKKTWVGIKKI